jgi:hypothetical protein
MKIKNLIAYVFLPAVFATTAGYAQDNSSPTISSLSQTVTTMKPGESHFMIVGLATLGFVNQATINTLGGLKTTDKNNSLGDADRFEFSPMFLWRHGDKLLAEFEPSFDGTAIGVNWADVSYYVAPGFIVRGGYLVLPFGTYTKRLAAGWINKLPSDPIGVDMAGTDFGVEVEGGFPLGSMKWSYDVSLTNGFQLNNDGTIQGVGISAINNGKTVCGRLALLPLSNSSLEIGASALYGSLAAPSGASFSNIDPNDTKGPATTMYAVDINYVKNINPVQVNIKGQYNVGMVNNVNYLSPIDSTETYTFTNTMSAAFGQISLRPSQTQNKILKNLELAYRYVDYKTPGNSTWGQNYTEQDIALDYWLSWRTVLKLGYENIQSTGTSNVTIAGLQGTTSINRLIIQFSTEF